MSEILKIDHLGIAVNNLENAIKVYESLGLKVTHRENVETQKVNTAMLPVGDTRLELLEPTTEASAVGKFLKNRGEGIHHLALQVDNIEEKLRELKELGMSLIDEVPRTGVGGTKVAFIHPQSTMGTMIEMVEHRVKGD